MSYNTQVLKGQKIKSLMTELKAHEKLVLTLKKKRHTVPEEDDYDEDGIKKFVPKNLNLKAVDEEVQIERDLENILERYHLDKSLAHHHKKWSSGDDRNSNSDHHVNSVLSDHNIKRDQQRFEEIRSESLYQKASELASDVFLATDDTSEKDKRRKKELEEWFISVERDITNFENRLKKIRFLERELQSLKTLRDDKNHIKRSQDHQLTPDDVEEDDLNKRIKELKSKTDKSEKELLHRINDRRYYEFPTSRSEGEL